MTCLKLLKFNLLRGLLTTCFLLLAFFVNAASFKIVLDAGHGGKDCGALGSKLKLKEKDVNLSVVMMLGKMLSAEKDIEVLYTRKTDVFIPLADRPVVANKANADLFVSIHSNAAENRAINGVETYTLGESRNDVSVRENKVAELEENYKSKYNFDGSDENFILSNMMLDAGSGGEMSIRLAQMVQGRFRANTDRSDRDVRQANFWVLKHILMPGVLVEIGYVSNVLEEVYLSKKANQELLAKSIFEAIIQYKDELQRKSQPLIEEVATDTISSRQATKVEDVADKAVKENRKEEVFFRIQLFSSNKQYPSNAPVFKRCTPVFEEKQGNLYKYMYGKETNFADVKMLKQKVVLDFPDAFIVVYRNGERLSGKDATQYFK